jgi:glutaredoxin
MESFTVYQKIGCPYCEKAIALLEQYELPHTVIVVSKEYQNHLKEKFNHGTFPMILHGKEFIGGYTELNMFLMTRCPNF